ncbi:hypothetical protein GGR79_002479 [Xanthomonas arboricola]|nr:hypothetical protein [Xanthomonas arboricola]NJC31012.1 hypothetical protein [Xanthomonas arboricola]
MTPIEAGAKFALERRPDVAAGRQRAQTARGNSSLLKMPRGRGHMHLLRKFQFPVKTAMVVGYVLVIREALVLWS